jgi:protein TonB
MNTATYFTDDSTNIKAMGFSIALHVFIVICVVYGFSITPAQFSTQQMIQVMLVSDPSSEKNNQKPKAPKKSTPKLEKVVKPKTVKQTKSEIAIKKLEPAQPASEEVKEHEFSELQPSSGTPSEAKESAQMITTAPLFDAAYLNNPVPEYPSHAKRRKMQGTVRLAVVVSADGTAKSVEIEESSGFAILDASAKKAVTDWKFVPAKLGNQEVEARVIVPIDFRLE